MLSKKEQSIHRFNPRNHLDLKRPCRAFCLAALLMAGAVEADAAVVDLIWSATSGAGLTGSNTIAAAPGDQLTLDILLSPDAAGVSSYGISLEFDTDLGNELDLLGTTELAPPPLFNIDAGVTSTTESDGLQRGAIDTFEAVSFTSGVAGGPVMIGQAQFQVTANVLTDGMDIFSGFFNGGIDGMFDLNGLDLAGQTDFGTAAVNAVPLPATLPLLFGGLSVIAAFRPRRRS